MSETFKCKKRGIHPVWYVYTQSIDDNWRIKIKRDYYCDCYKQSKFKLITTTYDKTQMPQQESLRLFLWITGNDEWQYILYQESINEEIYQ